MASRWKKPWTKAEEEIVIEHFETKGVDILSQELKRSKGAIALKYKELTKKIRLTYIATKYKDEPIKITFYDKNGNKCFLEEDEKQRILADDLYIN